MKLSKKIVSLLVCALLCTSCSTPGLSSQVIDTQQVNEEFEQRMDEYFKEVCLSNYSYVHLFFENPQAYGIDPDEAEVTFGKLLSDDEDRQQVNEAIAMLEEFNAAWLSDENRLIYDQLMWQLNLEKKMLDEKFDYLDQIWYIQDGLPQQIELLFANYALYTESDIEFMLEYFTQIPDLIEQARDYTGIQAQKGWLQFDEDYQLDYIDQILNADESESILSNLYEQIENLSLDATSESGYKAQVETAYETYYLPGYQGMREILEDNVSYNHSFRGLCDFPNGKEYYSLLLQYYAGCDKDGTQMSNYVIERYNETLFNMMHRVSSDEDLYAAYDIAVGMDDIDEMLDFLRDNYTRLFEQVSDLEIEIEPMSALESSDSTTRAYTKNMPIDYNGPYPVYYNQDFEDFDTIDFFFTLAHESIPGHIYQAVYQKEHDFPLISLLYDTLGPTESWASYGANCALEWLDVSKSDLELYRLADRFEQYLILWLDLEINFNGIEASEIEQQYGVDASLFDSLVQSPALYFAYYYGSNLLMDWKDQLSTQRGFDWKAYNNHILSFGEVNFDLLEQGLESLYGVDLE